jgi:hypothetical protein
MLQLHVLLAQSKQDSDIILAGKNKKRSICCCYIYIEFQESELNEVQFSSFIGKPSMRNLPFSLLTIAYCKSFVVISDGSISPSFIM